MAAWQFDLHALHGDSGRVLSTVEQAHVETLLDGVLDRRVMAGGWVMYGPDDGNRIDLAFDSAGCELDVRIDARSEAESFIDLVCVLMAHSNCTLFSAELDEMVQTDSRSLKKALQRSQAWMFALDSRAFLASKAKG